MAKLLKNYYPLFKRSHKGQELKMLHMPLTRGLRFYMKFPIATEPWHEISNNLTF